MKTLPNRWEVPPGYPIGGSNMKTRFLKRRLGAYLGLLLAVALVAAACSPAETETTSAAPAAAPAATDYGARCCAAANR